MQSENIVFCILSFKAFPNSNILGASLEFEAFFCFSKGRSWYDFPCLNYHLIC